ncbi:MAG TPA: MASE1 domain-containing protein [Gemmatimonadaceae bacterium]|nr:MASE1 domain-containing protein [Gemmatimonadaceae bacterium]
MGRRPTFLAALAAVYFAAGKLGLAFAAINSSASAVWPPTGIALAAFLLFGRRVWPAIFVGAFFVNLTTAGTVLTSLGVAAGNTLEGIVGAYLVHRFAGGRGAFWRPQNIFRFTVLAGLVSTMVSATIGVLSLSLGGFAQWNNFGQVWMTWWLGDAAGAITIAPLVILWYTTPVITWDRAKRIEAIALFTAVLALGIVVFAGPVVSKYPLAFLCVPALVWAAFRFGQREVATAVVMLSFIATAATELGAGPFVMATRNESLLVIQAFMGTIALVTLPMAALVAEQSRTRNIERAARHDAEGANRAKDVFLAMLSHELRNPLAAIASAITVIRMQEVSNPRTISALDVVDRQSKHLSRLVDDLLDVSRINSGKIALQKECVEMTVAISRAAEAVRPLIAARGHTFDIVLPDDAVWVDGDITRLAQIFSNILNNAAKYTPEDGRIRLSLEKVRGYAVVRVRDTGFGIPAAMLPRVFEPFTQGDQKMERSNGGLGLGLTLARRLVELHGGRIEAKSDGPGRGSEFIVSLPLSAAQPAIARARGHATEQLRPRADVRRVLLVDDNVEYAESTAELLRVRGNDVRIAHDGPTAVAIASEYRPQVALLDIGLPGMNGYEVAKRLRSLSSIGRISLVAISGYGQDDDRRRSREAGFDDHLVKPVPFDVLEQRLAKLQA